MVKLYVSKLSAEVTGEQLRTLFEQCGTVETAERVRNKEIGFVHMPNEKEAFLAVRNLNRAAFMGSQISVQISQVKIQKLFLGGLSDSATPGEVAELFERFGAKVVNVENTEKGFGFIRIENDRGFHALNQLVTNVGNYPFKGRCLKVELSEDLSKEEKARRKAEKDAAWEEELAAWESTPPELREAPGYSPFPEAGGSRGRGRGLSRGRGGPGSSWPQGPHANKMGRGGRGAPGGLLASASRGRGGLARPHPYPRPSPQPALEYGGGCAEEEKTETEDGKKLLNDYYSMMFENYTSAQTQLFETGRFSDFTIQCEGMEFRVHRVVLGPKSPVLMTAMDKEEVKPMLVRDVDSNTMQILLRFMYSGRVDVDGINPAKIMKLLTAADLYQVENVREGLEATLMENIREDTAVDYLIFSEELQLRNLRIEVSKFICSHSKQFKSRPDFRKLSQYPHLVMELFDHASYF